MSLIQSLLLLLLFSRVLGEIASRFGQPSMLGEIAAGIILGPSCLGYVHYTPATRGQSLRLEALNSRPMAAKKTGPTNPIVTLEAVC